jgi:hypothetical protein
MRPPRLVFMTIGGTSQSAVSASVVSLEDHFQPKPDLRQIAVVDPAIVQLTNKVAE